jgi:hypothetical protein
MRKLKFDIQELSGCSLGIGYHTKMLHIAVLFWALTIEYKR